MFNVERVQVGAYPVLVIENCFCVLSHIEQHQVDIYTTLSRVDCRVLKFLFVALKLAAPLLFRANRVLKKLVGFVTIRAC